MTNVKFQSAIRLDLDISGYIEICTYVIKPHEEVTLRKSISVCGFESEEIMWMHTASKYKIVVTKYNKVAD